MEIRPESEHPTLLKWKKLIYKVSLKKKYNIDKSLEFTEKEAEDLYDDLQKIPKKKFSIILPYEYVEILDDIVHDKSKKFKHIKYTRQIVIKQAISEYIQEKGYLITREAIQYPGDIEMDALLLLSGDVKKLDDFPPWVKGLYRRKITPEDEAIYIGDESKEFVKEYFAKSFKEYIKQRRNTNEENTKKTE